jgi:hypothetical protein
MDYQRHHLTTAYAPLSNGSVEVLNRVIIQNLKSLLSEFHMSENDWPIILQLVQLAMNLSPSRRLDY